MNLRSKIVGILLGLIVIAGGGIYFFIQRSLIGALLDLEKKDHLRNVERVSKAIDESTRSFATQLSDWAGWDDTYQFVEDLNQKYITGNLEWNTFDVLELNMLLYIDNQRKIRFFRGRDYTNEHYFKAPPSEILAFMRDRPELFQWKSNDDVVKGFVRSGNEVFQILLAPITTTDRKSPPRGTFFGARYFRQNRIKHFEDITHYKIQSRLLDPLAATDNLVHEPRPLDAESIVGNTIIRDIFGRPVLELSVEAPRLLFREGLKGIRTNVWLVVGICVAFLAAVTLLVDQLLLKRLQRVHHIVGSLRESDTPEVLAELDRFGSDEIGNMSSTIRHLYQKVRRLADVDGLTGLHNVRYFKRQVHSMMKLSQRHGRPLSLVICDVDFFKKINDQFGHPQGDEVLKSIARVLTKNTRSGDVCARYGGEEFLWLLTETSLAGAKIAAEKVRRAIEEVRVPRLDQPTESLKFTASFGVAELRSTEASFESFLERADAALYASKQGGRNRVSVEGTS